ncbi:MAG: DUF1501 domain-containing protein [Gemmataceae bacterium]|nr:DUF1501 domain-containing protein [Gemmataceae bacterium]
MHDTTSLTRRRLLQFSGALTLGGLWRAQAATLRPSKLRACILVFCYGGPSHLETWDPKPDAPAEVRGSFKPIATTVPGLRIGEHLPRLARVMHRCSLVRSMSHAARLHDSASIHALTGRPLDGPDRELFAPLPQVFPSYGSAVAHQRPGPEVPFASLPFAFNNVVPTPCQGAGFLGSAFDPLRIEESGGRFQADLLHRGEAAGRMADRRRLLERLERADPRRAALHDKAHRLLDSEAIRRAAQVESEPARVRERYGPGLRGRNLLLARRLVEAGVPFVNVHDFKQQGQNWDAHADGFNLHKDKLLPPADQALSALIEDLEARGLLDTTLVVAMGEFGRTPRINGSAGRDHWPDCYSVLLAGGGAAGGAVHGASDRLGAHPARDPAIPGDLAATIFWRFGLDHAAEIHDQAGRPHRLATGEPLRRLFGA